MLLDKDRVDWFAWDLSRAICSRCHKPALQCKRVRPSGRLEMSVVFVCRCWWCGEEYDARYTHRWLDACWADRS